jgi:hypothetical protein
MKDPIDQPGFNRNRYREPNPEMMARARGQGALYRSAQQAANDERAKLNEIVIELFRAGHSYRQISEATGLNIQPIQMVVAKYLGRESWEEK